MIDFIKMHGTLNDFVIIDCRSKFYNNIDYKAIANRKTGIGCDQIIVITKSEKADCFMHIYNADGSKVEMCGNAARCVAYLLSNEKQKNNVTIELADRILSCLRISENTVQVNMGIAKFHWTDIPISQECDTLHLPITLEMLSDPVGINVGNPHAIFFVNSIETIPLDKLGPKLENHNLFPKRANISIAEILSRNKIKLRVWERGTGETASCGSGACAALVAAVRRQYTDTTATICLQGGNLLISYQNDNTILMEGMVSYTFHGIYCN
ncbi:diaminopimelate epimerase [Ehrlichia canis]|uniref:Diaminopimelate epimerase n=1 Tax=Ehrlichia canis (strain Jake) TaxID=269484 RepID=A0ACA6AV00_EHRCJ|nr:diaminopimelate epimerase [Ehrlichia canis]AAZ68077.1 diaminopimelate epimerase [Ehrlichia canis str. Jake]AUO54334.1 diaminopimelate epimerase [Ehrlichia canis]UKC53417.1 diaminopimelate epimerase [Ehrlichia canis]UKC54353.1 diaminopimelate epimerase [Ehrlichia canis]UKC55290.1 diaminopimelate epimerase [Ehrlichia canis]